MRGPKTGFVYLFNRSDGAYKIGWSATPQLRVRDFDKPQHSVRLRHVIESTDACWLERALHHAFWHRHIGQEWFRLEPDEVDLFCSFRTCNGIRGLPLWAKRMACENILRSRAIKRFSGRPARKRMVVARFLIGMSVAELADKVGLSDITVQAIEAGICRTTPQRWEAIAAVLGEPAERLAEIL
jgi:DNA-binding XRE family transcriptional regulator